MILNTPADLAALKGTPDYAAALKTLLGSTQTWVNQAPAGSASDWRLVTVLSTIKTMGFMSVDDLVAECAAAGVVAPPAPAAPPAAPPAPAPTCLLWQLEAVCNAPPASLGFTPPTWAQVQAAVQAQNNAALTAFFNVGVNSIPADSKTLLALAAALPTPLSAAQVASLIAAAAAIVID